MIFQSLRCTRTYQRGTRPSELRTVYNWRGEQHIETTRSSLTQRHPPQSPSRLNPRLFQRLPRLHLHLQFPAHTNKVYMFRYGCKVRIRNSQTGERDFGWDPMASCRRVNNVPVKVRPTASKETIMGTAHGCSTTLCSRCFGEGL